MVLKVNLVQKVNLADQLLVHLVLMVIQVNLVLWALKVNENKNIILIHIIILGERGPRGAPGLPGNSSSLGGLPGPQGRTELLFFLNCIKNKIVVI